MEFAPHTANKNLRQKIHCSPLFDISQFILFIGAILWFFCTSGQKMGYQRQCYQILNNIFAHEETGYCTGPLWDSLVALLPTTDLWSTAAGIYLTVALTLFFNARWFEHRFQVAACPDDKEMLHAD